jgi:hypothetical protein
MDKGIDMQTLRGFKFGPREEWMETKGKEEGEVKEIRKRKLDKEMQFMQYDPSHVGKDAGEFVRVQTKTRLNLLRAAKEAKGESILDNSVLNLNNQVITTNLGYKKNKRRKYYNRYAKQPVQIKTKFEMTAQIRTEWIETAKIDSPDYKKMNIDHEVTVISQSGSEERKFRTDYLKNRTKGFPKIKCQKSGFIPPHDIRKDEELLQLYENEVIPKGKVGVFVSENVLYTLGAINISKFPFVLKSEKKENKIKIWYDVTPENCFMFWESYRESTNENYIEDEEKIQKLSMESTQIMEAYQVESINPPDKSFEKKADSLEKTKLQEMRKEAADKEFKRKENNRVLKIEIGDKIVLYTRVGLEGKDAKGKEVLVKALYDMRKLLNNKNKGDDVFLDCIQFNSFRITKWMVQAYFTGNKHNKSFFKIFLCITQSFYFYIFLNISQKNNNT